MKPYEVTVGILTALSVELRAMAELVDDVHRYRAQGDPNLYRIGTIPSSEPDRPHRIALLMTPRDGTQLAATCCAHMLRTFPNIDTVIMTGIAGGIPRPERPAKHVRLGDIVVAKDGIVNYGSVRRQDGTSRLRGPQGAGLISYRLLQAVGELGFEANGGDRRWERWLDPTRSTPAAQYPRPSPATDVLYVHNTVVDHPAPEPPVFDGMPRVHYGLIGSADVLMADEKFRDRLAREFPDMLAVEMEGSGIAASTSMISKGWFMVRGVADYSEVAGKNDVWHGYASFTAAAYVRALLEVTQPVEISEPPQTVRVMPLLGDDDQRALDALLIALPSDLDVEPAWQEVIRRHGVPDPERPPAEVPSTPAQAYHFLAGRNAAGSGLSPAIVFLALLDGLIRDRDPAAADRLGSWLAAYCERSGISEALRARLRPESGAGSARPAAGPSLVVEIAVDGIDRDRFRVVSYVQEDTGPWNPRQLGVQHVTTQQIETAVSRSVAEAERAWAEHRTTGRAGIEFVLPGALMNLPVQWYSDLRMGVERPICVRYPVAVRSQERMRAEKVRREWASRWDRLDRRPFDGQVQWGIRYQPRPITVDSWSTGLSGDDRYVVVVLSEPPTPESEFGLRELFAALEAGVPVIVWDQRPAHPRDDTTGELRQLTAEPAVLPDRIRTVRVEAVQQADQRPDHYGRSVALLWDDPNRVVGAGGDGS